MTHLQFTILSAALILCVCSLFLARTRRLKISYALVWFGTSISIAATACIPGFIPLVSRITGLYYITALLLFCFGFLVILSMHFSMVISKLMHQNRQLGERVAFLEQRMDEQLHTD